LRTTGKSLNNAFTSPAKALPVASDRNPLRRRALLFESD